MGGKLSPSKRNEITLMKTQAKHSKNNLLLIHAIVLLILTWTVGCSDLAHHPDPLAGWHFSSLNNLDSNKAIMDDYQDYLQKLPPRRNGFIGSLEFFEDATDQHAIKVRIGVNGTWWVHVLIYDKNDKRIQVTTYRSGGYRS